MIFSSGENSRLKTSMVVSSDMCQDVPTLPRPLVLPWDLGIACHSMGLSASIFNVVKAPVNACLRRPFLSYLCFFFLFCACVCVYTCLYAGEGVHASVHTHACGGSLLRCGPPHWPGTHRAGSASWPVSRDLSATPQHRDCTSVPSHLSF